LHAGMTKACTHTHTHTHTHTALYIYWFSKATWFCECASMLRYTYISCRVSHCIL